MCVCCERGHCQHGAYKEKLVRKETDTYITCMYICVRIYIFICIHVHTNACSITLAVTVTVRFV